MHNKSTSVDVGTFNLCLKNLLNIDTVNNAAVLKYDLSNPFKVNLGIVISGCNWNGMSSCFFAGGRAMLLELFELIELIGLFELFEVLLLLLLLLLLLPPPPPLPLLLPCIFCGPFLGS